MSREVVTSFKHGIVTCERKERLRHSCRAQQKQSSRLRTTRQTASCFISIFSFYTVVQLQISVLKHKPEKTGFFFFPSKCSEGNNFGRSMDPTTSSHQYVLFPSLFLWLKTKEEKKMIEVHLPQFKESFPSPSSCLTELAISLSSFSWNVVESKCRQHLLRKLPASHTEKDAEIHTHWRHRHAFSFIPTAYLSSVIFLLRTEGRNTNEGNKKKEE